jgi:hypothetical protein
MFGYLPPLDSGLAVSFVPPVCRLLSGDRPAGAGAVGRAGQGTLPVHAMICISLDSSCIDRVCYDFDTGYMRIEFLSGGEVEHSGVPAWHFEGIRDAESPGRYWHEHLKNEY